MTNSTDKIRIGEVENTGVLVRVDDHGREILDVTLTGPDGVANLHIIAREGCSFQTLGACIERQCDRLKNQPRHSSTGHPFVSYIHEGDDEGE